MADYEYSPLSDPFNTIRLFRLLPGPNSAAIQGELVEYDLRGRTRTTHAYEALSYVWGQSENPESIYIGDYRFEVTPHLHAALLRLRDSCFSRILWIDALCINQTDDDEKSSQIELMALIYAVAKEVIIWLGEEADDSDEAFEALRNAALNHRISAGSKEIEDANDSEWSESSDSETRAQFQQGDELEVASPSTSRKSSLSELSTSPHEISKELEAMDPSPQYPTQSIVGEKQEAAVDLLLQRAWFRRVWVRWQSPLKVYMDTQHSL